MKATSEPVKPPIVINTTAEDNAPSDGAERPNEDTNSPAHYFIGTPNGPPSDCADDKEENWNIWENKVPEKTPPTETKKNHGKNVDESTTYDPKKLEGT